MPDWSPVQRCRPWPSWRSAPLPLGSAARHHLAARRSGRRGPCPRVNDYGAAVAADYLGRFFATLPMPHIERSVDEAVHVLDDLHADGVVILGNSAGTYLGEERRKHRSMPSTGVRRSYLFIRPNCRGHRIRSGAVAAGFLLYTTRAATLLCATVFVSRYRKLRLILSHAGGFFPYAAHRLAMGITGDTERNPLDSLDEFAGLYFGTALSSTVAALPSLLASPNPATSSIGPTGRSRRWR